MLFNFLVDGDFLQVGIVLLQFKPFGRILLVLVGDVTGDAGYAAGLLLGALHDHLDTLVFAFFCHL